VSDRLQGIAWIAVGAVILYGSWTMDRLERHGAALYTAPGLVPGLLGFVILLLGMLLAARARRQEGAAWGTGWAETAVVLALCLGFAAGVVGRIPFWLATFVFVTAFIAVFEYPVRRRMAVAPVYGAATSLLVTWLFESVFLVRLP
jgi:hypothetical protein